MISQDELDTVDPEIRNIIQDINLFPFADTMYSCAGYGASGGIPIEDREHSHRSRFFTNKNFMGYFDAMVIITYDKTKPGWRRFHLLFSKLFDEVTSHHFWRKKINQPTFVYVIHEDRKRRLPLRWREVAKFLKQELAR